jgi:lipoprotein NlpD
VKPAVPVTTATTVVPLAAALPADPALQVTPDAQPGTHHRRFPMRLRRAAARSLLPLALTLMLAGCASSPPAHQARVHVVQRGETLFAIAARYGLDYRDLARWNRLADADMIHVGQHIRLTPAASRSSRSSASASASASASSSAAVAAARPVPRSARPTVAGTAPSSAARRAPSVAGRSAPSVPPNVAGRPAPRASARRTPSPPPPPAQAAPAPRWQWPTAGTVVSTFGSSAGIPSGIGIGGRIGQPVEAAASGRVVYAGSGLIGYGQLVIIRHNDTYLTAYGHNRRLLVEQGDTVARGQKIAEMGYGPKREPRLHFEIRRNGTPVDPLAYLSGPTRLAGAP